MDKLYRDITFAKDNIDKVKRYSINRGDEREYLADTFKWEAVDNIKQLIKILSKFY